MKTQAFLAAIGTTFLVVINGCAFASSGSVTGQVECNVERCLIRGFGISGAINAETAAEFSGLIDNLKAQASLQHKRLFLLNRKVDLNSLGGSISDAIKIGRIMRKERLTASVKTANECTSACVLIDAGAVKRLNFGKIGIHQPYFLVPNEAVQPDAVGHSYSIMLKQIRSYLNEMNVSESLADEMLKILPSDVKYLTHDQQEQFGITFTDPVEREIYALQEAKTLNIDRAEYNRRQALWRQSCPIEDPDFQHCATEAIKSGKVPLPDLSSFGTRVE